MDHDTSTTPKCINENITTSATSSTSSSSSLIDKRPKTKHDIASCSICSANPYVFNPEPDYLPTRVLTWNFSVDEIYAELDYESLRLATPETLAFAAVSLRCSLAFHKLYFDDDPSNDELEFYVYWSKCMSNPYMPVDFEGLNRECRVVNQFLNSCASELVSPDLPQEVFTLFEREERIMLFIHYCDNLDRPLDVGEFEKVSAEIYLIVQTMDQSDREEPACSNPGASRSHSRPVTDMDIGVGHMIHTPWPVGIGFHMDPTWIFIMKEQIEKRARKRRRRGGS